MASLRTSFATIGRLECSKEEGRMFFERAPRLNRRIVKGEAHAIG